MTNNKITFIYLLLAHHPYSELDRTVKICIGKTDLFLCTRCTGQYLGIIVYLSFFLQEPTVNLLISSIILLPLPATLDWLTQTLKWRKSTTLIRLITGFLFGIWIGVLVHAIKAWNINLLIVMVVQSFGYMSFVMAILYKNHGCIDDYLKPYEEFIAEYERQRQLP